MALGRIKKRQIASAAKLQITSMMDMFTIILIFLLFSFSDNPETANLEKGLKLPESTAKLSSSENIKIILTPSELILDGESIAKIKNGNIEGFNTNDLKDSPLYKQLKLHNDRLAQQESEGEADKTNTKLKEQTSQVLFLCDKRHSFKTINTIIKVAGMAGYPNFQFAVLNKDF